MSAPDYDPALDDRDDTAAEDHHHDRTHRRLSRGEEQDRQNAAEREFDALGGCVVSAAWKVPDPAFAAEVLDGFDESDPERAHAHADDVLLANVHPNVAAAHARLVARCKWWATA